MKSDVTLTKQENVIMAFLESRSKPVLCGMCMAVSWSTAGIAETPVHNTGVDAITSVTEKSFGFRQGNFIAAPIPILVPSLKAGLAVMGGYLFKLDEKSDSSYLGLGGFYTENNSYGYGLAGSFSFDENTWKIDFFAGRMNLNYDLDIGGAVVPINQESPAVVAGFQYEFYNNLYVGLRGTYLDNTISLGSGGIGVLPPDVARDASVAVAIAELTFGADTRDDTIYPTSGYNVFVSAGKGDRLDSRAGSFSKVYTNMDYFFPVGNGVIASELTLCSADRNSPFYLLCSLGGTDNLRGFSATEFIGESLASLQVEYRGMIGERIGYAAFLGGGKIGSPISPSSAGFNYSYGVGVRYRVSKQFKVDFSIDIARNNFSNDQLHIYLGQRF